MPDIVNTDSVRAGRDYSLSSTNPDTDYFLPASVDHWVSEFDETRIAFKSVFLRVIRGQLHFLPVVPPPAIADAENAEVLSLTDGIYQQKIAGQLHEMTCDFY